MQQVVKNLKRRSLSGTAIQLTVLAPLWELSSFLLPPFYISASDSAVIEAFDEDSLVKGCINTLVLQGALWVSVIGSKQSTFSLAAGIPQVLSYMLAAHHKNPTVYGLVTNGTDFVFLKLTFGDIPRYGRSEQFVLGQKKGLEQVLKTMKHLSEVIVDKA